MDTLIVDWASLTPQQRDRLVHERVMGHSLDEPCKGMFWLCTNTQTGAYGYQCSICGAYHDVGTEDIHLPPEPPLYTAYMNAAWQVVEKITQPPTEPLGLQAPNVLFMQWWEHADLWAMSKDEAAEAICMAALRACGAVFVKHLTISLD